MVAVLRLVLLLVIAMLLLSVVLALATSWTGIVEKVVLVAIGLLLIAAAARVRRLGAGPPQPH